MKLRSISYLSAVTSLTLGWVLCSHPSTLAQAARKVSFVCGRNSNGDWATVAKTRKGDVPVINWVSDYFGESGWTPERRCQEVSQRFQEFNQQGLLEYLTTGKMNGMPVVCVSQSDNAGCAGLLFTLKPQSVTGEAPGDTLKRLLDVRVGASGPLNESTSRTYIKIDEVLNKPAIGSNSQAVTPDPSAIPTSQNPGGGLW